MFITDDNLVEEVETFTLELALDSFEVQSGVLVVQNQTTISIVDDDGVHKPNAFLEWLIK